MTKSRKQEGNSGRRAEEAVLAVLPRSVRTRIPKRDIGADIVVNGQSLTIKWAGKGQLGDVRRILHNRRNRPDVVVARRMSPGAREVLSKAGIGWVDETGAAEIAIGMIVVSRSGTPSKTVERSNRWTPAVIAIAEALLCGIKPTVSATESMTGLSVGSCTNALRTLTDLGLLEAEAERGRDSARQVADTHRLLESYASAVAALPAQISLQVGVMWRDSVDGLVATGKRWERGKVTWASTGAVAASVIAPYLTRFTSTEVYVASNTIVGLESIAARVGLKSIRGGRLTLKPFPTATVRNMIREVDGLLVAPWPRVYVDLRNTGVRGEEAAEHLLDAMYER